MKDILPLAMETAKSETVAQFQGALERAMDCLGASCYSALCFDSTGHGPAPFRVHNTPEQLLDLWSNADDAKIDPVMQHCRTSSTPIVWGRSHYDGPIRWHWEAMADFGMQQGVCLPLHLDRHRHFLLGVEWKDSFPLALSERDHIVSSLQTIAVFAEPAAQRLWGMERNRDFAPDVPLRPIELECLYWVTRGMTDSLIAPILGIKSRTVKMHINNSIRKLGAANRTEAAFTATRLGLLGSLPPSRD